MHGMSEAVHTCDQLPSDSASLKVEDKQEMIQMILSDLKREIGAKLAHQKLCIYRSLASTIPPEDAGLCFPYS